MDTVKVINNRKDVGYLFHYSHFVKDCLFPEVVNELYKYKKIVREKNPRQTLGIFSELYRSIMGVEHNEVSKEEFDTLDVKTITYGKAEDYKDRRYFDIFRNYIFTRYNINSSVYDTTYPEVILIKRGNERTLVDDDIAQHFKNDPKWLRNGKARREIDNIEGVESYLKEKYSNKFQSIILENMPFEEQIKYFNNCKLIVAAHGAGMLNMFYCKEGTTMIEVTCGKHWPFFDVITSVLKINYIKCMVNIYTKIIEHINKIESIN